MSANHNEVPLFRRGPERISNHITAPILESSCFGGEGAGSPTLSRVDLRQDNEPPHDAETSRPVKDELIAHRLVIMASDATFSGDLSPFRSASQPGLDRHIRLRMVFANVTTSWRAAVARKRHSHLRAIQEVV